MSEASFDTNILIDALNGFDSARSELRRVERRWISRISWIEVMAGIDAESAARIERFLDGFAIDEITEEIARRAAVIRSENRRVKLPDAIILASAQAAGRTLVTRNTRDFPSTLPGIRIPYQL